MTSHYLNQWWSSLLMHICVTQLQWVNRIAWIRQWNFKNKIFVTFNDFWFECVKDFGDFRSETPSIPSLCILSYSISLRILMFKLNHKIFSDGCFTSFSLFSLLAHDAQGVQFTSRLWPCNSLSWLKAMGTATAQHIWCVHTTSGWCMYVNFSELLRE